MKRPWQQWWRVTWRLAICSLLLLWIFHTIFLKEARQELEGTEQTGWEQLTLVDQWQAAWYYGPRALWDTLSLIDLPYFLISIVCMGATILLGAMRWRLLLVVQRLRLSIGRAIEISFVAHFFNSFLLGSTGGDLLKAYYVARETHTRKMEAVITVFVDRLLGLFAMLLFACVMMVPNAQLMGSDPRFVTIGWLVSGLLLACALVVGLSFWGGVSRVWPSVRHGLTRLPKGDLLERSLEACRRFGPEKGYLIKAMGLSMVLNSVCVAQILSIAWGLGLEVPWKAFFVVVPVIICLSAIPITPNGLGIRENLYVFMLTVPAIGVGPTKALAVSLLAYAGSLIWSLVGGIVYVTLKESEQLADLAEAGEEEGEMSGSERVL